MIEAIVTQAFKTKAPPAAVAAPQEASVEAVEEEAEKEALVQTVLVSEPWWRPLDFLWSWATTSVTPTTSVVPLFAVKIISTGGGGDSSSRHDSNDSRRVNTVQHHVASVAKDIVLTHPFFSEKV